MVELPAGRKERDPVGRSLSDRGVAEGHVVPRAHLGRGDRTGCQQAPGLAARFEYTPRTAFVAVVPVLTYDSISVVVPDALAVYENACAIPAGLLSA